MASLTRKAFLGVGATAVGLGVFGGIVRALANEDAVLRPPLVDDEGEFAARCVRCCRCIEVCHTHALVPAVIEDGVLVMKTPKFDFHRGSCDFCNECADVCPTDAIKHVDSFDPEAGCIGVAVVQTDRCVAYFNGCRKCAEQCPFEVISLNENGYPVVDEKRCNGCGVCEFICPALVYRSFSGGNRRGIVVVRTEEQTRVMTASLQEGGENA